MHSRFHRFLTHPVVAALLIGHLVFGGLALLWGNGGFEAAELFAYDRLVAANAERDAPTRPISLIGITEADIQEYGWPITDGLLAGLLAKLVALSPQAIGVDIYRDIPVGEGAVKLDQVLTANSNIIFAEKFPDAASAGVAPPPALAGTAQVGFTDVAADPGGIVRRGLLFLNDTQRNGTSLALQLALLSLAQAGVQPEPDATHPDHLRLGSTTFNPFEGTDGSYVAADARGYQFLLDYRGINEPFPTLSLAEVLQSSVSPGVVRDRIVLIGVISESVNDYFYAPVATAAYPSGRVPGVTLHALAADQILRLAGGDSKPLATLSDRQEYLWLWIWCLAGAGIAVLARSLIVLGIGAATGVFLIYLSGSIAFNESFWLPVVTPAIGWVLSMGLVTAWLSMQERQAKLMLMRLFSRHVSPEVAKVIWEERDQILKDGQVRSQRLTATVLFTDMVGFTAVSEKLEPQVLMAWLNVYMDEMTRLVINNGGIVDKYIGDAVMAVWGVPFARQTEAEVAADAEHAVTTALAMRQRLAELNAGWQQQGLAAISMRVGIHTGPVVAGGLGSRERADYTVIGDTVNVASRLESYDKSLQPDASGCRILVGDTTEQYARHAFRMQPVGSVELKGRERPMQVFHVIDRIQ